MMSPIAGGERVQSGASWIGSRWSRLHDASRLQGVDLARGLAILGMFAAHLVLTRDIVWTDPSTWSGVVDGRSSILFATLAGVSLGLVSGGSTPPRRLGRIRARIAVRAVLIWVLGTGLIALEVPVYVILPAYGILFLLAIPLLSLRPAVLFSVAAAIALVIPFV